MSGVAMVVLNPKNLALTLAGAAAIVQLDEPGGIAAATVAAFTTLAVSLLLAALLAYALAPVGAASLLTRARLFTATSDRS